MSDWLIMTISTVITVWLVGSIIIGILDGII